MREKEREREREEGVGGDFGCVRFGRFTRRKRHSIFLPCTMSDEDRNEACSARAPKPNAAFENVSRDTFAVDERDAACSSEMHALLLACLAFATPKAGASRRAKFICMQEHGKERGRGDPFSTEVVLRRSVEKKGEKRGKKKGWGNAEETTLCGVWEQSAKSIGSHSKDDRAIDAHHELHTNIGVH